MKNAPKLGSDDAEKVKGKEFGTKENDLQPAGKKECSERRKEPAEQWSRGLKSSKEADIQKRDTPDLKLANPELFC